MSSQSTATVWNGRNERILGSAIVSTSTSTASLSANNEENNDCHHGQNNPPTPRKNVWNGKHDTIIRISDKAPAATTDEVGEDTIHGSGGLTLKMTTKRKKDNGVDNSDRTRNSRDYESFVPEKEGQRGTGFSNRQHGSNPITKTHTTNDEATDSTASTTTNATLEEEDVTISTVPHTPPTCSTKSNVDQNSDSLSDVNSVNEDGLEEQQKDQKKKPPSVVVADEFEKQGGSSTSSNGIEGNIVGFLSGEEVKSKVSVSNNPERLSNNGDYSDRLGVGCNRDGHCKSNDSSNGVIGNIDENSNNHGGISAHGNGNSWEHREKKPHRYHSASSNFHDNNGGNWHYKKKQQYGNANDGSRGARGFSRNGVSNSRRKAKTVTSHHSDVVPLCSFFVRGICNRGSACTFRHDPVVVAHDFTPRIGAMKSLTDEYNLKDSGHSRTSNDSSSNCDGAGKALPTNMASIQRFGSSRVYDPLKARAIQIAKNAQDNEDRSIFASPATLRKDPSVPIDDEPPFFSIDVECVATGYGSCAKGINDGCGNEGRYKDGVPSNQYNDASQRYPGRIAMVDTDGNLLVDLVIRPPHDGKGVKSYLTELTGLTPDLCLGPDAKTLEDAIIVVKSFLPKNGVLIGQSIHHDVEWLGLIPGVDFDRMVDISIIFRQRLPTNLSNAADAVKHADSLSKENNEVETSAISDESLGFATRYRSFSLRHVCLNLLGTDIQSGVHDPIIDARYSLQLFHKYRNSSVIELRIVRDALHRAPLTPGFAERSPVVEGVCVNASGFTHKRAGKKIWRWYVGRKNEVQSRYS